MLNRGVSDRIKKNSALYGVRPRIRVWKEIAANITFGGLAALSVFKIKKRPAAADLTRNLLAAPAILRRRHVPKFIERALNVQRRLSVIYANFSFASVKLMKRNELLGVLFGHAAYLPRGTSIKISVLGLGG